METEQSVISSATLLQLLSFSFWLLLVSFFALELPWYRTCSLKFPLQSSTTTRATITTASATERVSYCEFASFWQLKHAWRKFEAMQFSNNVLDTTVTHIIGTRLIPTCTIAHLQQRWRNRQSTERKREQEQKKNKTSRVAAAQRVSYWTPIVLSPLSRLPSYLEQLPDA